MTRTIPASAAKAAIHGGGEVAFLDLREAGPFSMGHPLFAVPCPFSVFELRVGALVPRQDVPILLLDGGDGVAALAAERLAEMGYVDVSVIEGGAPGWEAAGYTLFKGVNVPCKLLGELVGETREPKRIGPDELAQWQAEGRDFAFYDCRPRSEFSKMTVPGTACLPNGEVAHRLPAAARPGQPVLLTCAGRTRGLIGAVSLAEVAPEVDVYALENGTQGWALSGRELLRGNTPGAYPELDEGQREETAQRARRFMADKGIPEIDASGVRDLLADPARTTFLLDVRSSEEARDDPLPAFTPALSVQLVQASDQWIGVRRARVVLADDLGLRAAIAARWLRALGCDARVLRIDEAARAIPPRAIPAPRPVLCEQIDARAALERSARGGVRWIDVRSSDAYRAGHVAGAAWALRTDTEVLREGAEAVILIGDGSGRAELIAGDLKRSGAGGDVACVQGGHAALVAAGAAVQATPDQPPELASPDVTWFAHGRHDGDLDASRTYLDWEVGLEHQLDAQERAEYAL
ncbi:rhodanese [Rhodovulum sp. 12E13]|uniref:rhodanese-like domain-containing protein n=1 Tax=Rhodovulum sp. 12E13 TaxID=2203891 RepID=UPI000E14334D|nr:rhodanese-like domain-containing protein [Rhodovulum sp. 12E13]RDC75313.1 rhodanese [Rhodovulum sp. 12E13]